ncbi:MAG: hypothetical protein KatS3mg109_1724 [Pirellulaceae bacterium]|nr:MAG: hypothetical protein KatS3mg109_1724 [Pirellulaceae bacterium]
MCGVTSYVRTDRHMCYSAIASFMTLLQGAFWTVWLVGVMCLPAIAEPPSKRSVPEDHPQRAKEGLKLFREQVAEILTKRCLSCHGGETVKGHLDLSTREKLLASGMVGDDAASSHLFAVASHAEEPFMPKDGPRLSDQELAALGRWLDLGAPYDHPLGPEKPAGEVSSITEKERNYWAFRPLSHVAPPSLTDPWIRTDVDRFILEKLRAAGIVPNAPADRYTLIRRAYFDLIGLPPTPEEVAAFVNDPDPNAYEKLLDKLLASPHYGERWARHWMDIARFAESHGYEQDYDRPHAYHYRDFLIRAFNEDMPYDQFVKWQVAGDELAPDNPLALMATGFLGAGAFPTQLTEAEFESARYDELDDMANTLGTAILGLTIGCARCHEHKYDPIPVTDYYRFIANFTTTIRSEIELDLDPEENQKRKEQFEQELSHLREQLKRVEEQEIAPGFEAWLERLRTEGLSSQNWLLLPIGAIQSTGKSTYRSLADGSWLAEGEAPKKETLTVEAALPLQRIVSLRLETLADPSLPRGGPGRAPNGNFAIGDVRVWLVDGDSLQPLALCNPRATHQQNADSLSIAASLDNDPISGWAVDQGGIGKNQAAVFDLVEPIQVREGQRLRVQLKCEHPNGQHSPGRIRLSAGGSSEMPADLRLPIPLEVQRAIEKLASGSALDAASRSSLYEWRVATDAGYQELKRRLEKLEKQGPPLKLTKVQVTSEGFPHMKHHADERGFPHFYPQTFVLHRGDVHQKKQVAEPGYLQVLMRNGYTPQHWQVPKPDGWTRTSFHRAALAEWLMDVENGAGNLAARVIVNRIWQHHFGRGIVATPSDFGLQGEPPTHPELLEWLATDLVHHGWRLKRLHKLIMTSAVYMQSSRYDEQRASVDRENHLLWRFSPRRLEAEPIRDAMLAVSGMLDTTMYGPGTLDPNMQRRSIYFFIKRSQLIPMMMLFDWPEHLVGIGQRATTTVAPQALALMNSPQCRQYARGFAERVLAQPESQRLAYAFLATWTRLPSEEQILQAQRFLEDQALRHQQAGNGDGTLAAWTDFCQALISASPFLYVE